MRKIATALASLWLVLGLAAAATADSWTARDRGGRGPLRIHDIRTSHSSRGPVLTVTLDRPLNPAAMGREDFVVVDVEVDGRGKSERWIYFISDGRRLRSVSYYPKTASFFTGGIQFSRPNPRQIRFVPVTYYEHQDYGGHAFAVGAFSKTPGCGRGCWDVTPNRGYFAHDYRRPEIRSFVPPAGYWFEPEVPVSWVVKDDGLSGLRGVTLRLSEAGSGKWRDVATRRSEKRQKVTLPGREGAHMMFQLVAEDGARNVTRSGFVLTRIPFDQSSDAAPGTFRGLWLEEDDEGAYGGTVHRSTAPLDSLTFPGEGNAFCVLVRWASEDSGSATLRAGDATQQISHAGGTGVFNHPYCVDTGEQGEQTATLTVQSGRVKVDGYWNGVNGRWTRAGTLRGPALGEHAHDHRRLVTTKLRRANLRALRTAALNR